MMRLKKRRTRKFRDDVQRDAECYFCKLKEEPDFKDVLKLKRYISDRGKIISKQRTGACSKHQRKLTNEIKRARFLALLPYTERHAL